MGSVLAWLRLSVVVTLGAVTGACGGDDPPGAPDAGIDQGTGIVVNMAALAEDGTLADGDAPLIYGDLTVESMTFQFHKLLLIGDTAPVGEVEVPTTSFDYPTVGDAQMYFADAPPGLYSRVHFDVERTFADEDPPAGFDGERLALRVVGTIELTDGARPFIYTDDVKTPVRLDLDRDLQPGQTEHLQIGIDPHIWLGELDWESLAAGTPGGEPIVLDEDEDAANGLRGALHKAFIVLP